ncbi:hypothetical protein FV232_04580 [Methylobacterium sp. WL30]|uniref:hypothetical protein n=1 Tax=unclassified Methylobacterium TaxID=2615210 RepID=UPI0011CAE7C3|nr:MULTISPECIES: hypothetical protein [unclassified Methylobacterium]TXM92862.1 hypothetical protein FV223_10390 [Methylobacterium sp. WL116]TXN41532.1 hypothetical protein FV225_01985 [Methylobacterium sp. WL93]TXN52460.1 hypothetical protein FV227_03200 [Methylobacterium sp. WL119]TXN69737.1 hypothetical protein FV232_04580 [Methylobacterium sp. WL30]
MKTVIAALVVTTFASVLPVAASELAPTLRRSDDTAAVSTEGKDTKAGGTSVEAQSARKIRVVLASPYGN